MTVGAAISRPRGMACVVRLLPGEDGKSALCRRDVEDAVPYGMNALRVHKREPHLFAVGADALGGPRRTA